MESQIKDPVFSGTGIGRKLFDDAMAYCYEKRYTQVYLLTTDIQRRAIAMYTKAGFHPTSSQGINQWGKILREERYDLTLS